MTWREMSRRVEGRWKRSRLGPGGCSEPSPLTGEGHARTALLVAIGVLLSGCGAAGHDPTGTGIPGTLLRQLRPVGRGPRFQPPVAGAPLGRCLPRLGGREGVHLEVFAADRVVLVPAGIGAGPPLSFSGGRLTDAGCYGDLVTLEPTGVVLARPGAHLRLSDLFRSWGRALSRRRLASFSAAPGQLVSVFVDGRRWSGPPGAVPLRRHAEIVVEVGPDVPPHSSFAFPPGL